MAGAKERAEVGGPRPFPRVDRRIRGDGADDKCSMAATGLSSQADIEKCAPRPKTEWTESGDETPKRLHRRGWLLAGGLRGLLASRLIRLKRTASASYVVAHSRGGSPGTGAGGPPSSVVQPPAVGRSPSISRRGRHIGKGLVIQALSRPSGQGLAGGKAEADDKRQ